MGLFGKKKTEEPENEDIINEEEEQAAAEEEDSEEVTDSFPEEEEGSGEGEQKIELSAEDKFKNRCAEISRAVRMMFPQQMLVGYYYAELQADGYIDDFCCYAGKGELLEKDEIPSRTGMTDAEMIAREEKLEQAFFLFRRAAVEFTEKACNGVTVTLFGNGQAKLDIVSDDLVEGEEDQRYAAFRQKVELGNPRYQPPKMDQKTIEAIRDKTKDIYQAMGQSLYNFIPGNEFRVAHFYSEFSERGVFFFYRCYLNDGTLLEKEDLFKHFGIDLAETEERRNDIIKNAMAFRQAFVSENARPFSAISLSITGNGKFTTSLSYGPTDEAGEQVRLDEWKQKNTDEGFPPVERAEKEELSKKLSAAGIDPELQEKVNSIYMELGSEYFSYLPETEFHRAYFLCEFSEDGVFTYQRMILKDGGTVEDDEMVEKYGMDAEQTETNRAKIIEMIDDIRQMISDEGETAFSAMTLAISDRGEFRSYMSFDPVDPENRDERLAAWRAQYNGGETIG